MTACDPYNLTRTFDPLIHDIDYNNHINNTVYSNWAIEAIPHDFRHSHRLKKLEVNFKEESFLEDRISSGLNITHTSAGISCEHKISQRDSHHTIALAKSVWKKD